MEIGEHEPSSPGNSGREVLFPREEETIVQGGKKGEKKKRDRERELFSITVTCAAVSFWFNVPVRPRESGSRRLAEGRIVNLLQRQS